MRQIARFAILISAALLVLTIPVPPTTFVDEQWSGMRVAHSQAVHSLAAEDPAPGVRISGHVRLENGQGVPGTAIYQAFAPNWPGTVAAITDQEGFYQSEFVEIPGRESVMVYSKRACYTFYPDPESWLHEYGHEERTVDFTAPRS